mmetsp:Transcript_25219/g.65836  ORF Transcript_25219/g.65836 Transcript_25219/m.65836 type:complete len:208 (+) Transcript_25219:145-768(+)
MGSAAARADVDRALSTRDLWALTLVPLWSSLWSSWAPSAIGGGARFRNRTFVPYPCELCSLGLAVAVVAAAAAAAAGQAAPRGDDARPPPTRLRWYRSMCSSLAACSSRITLGGMSVLAVTSYWRGGGNMPPPPSLRPSRCSGRYQPASLSLSPATIPCGSGISSNPRSRFASRCAWLGTVAGCPSAGASRRRLPCRSALRNRIVES